MNLPTPQYVLPVYLCRFAVRVPYGLSLADFLGSMITGTRSLPEKKPYLSGSARIVDLPAILITYTL